ncbi:MAG: glycosyltransferase family 2 protein [Roseiflexaceae bacterium]|nr:glycosyltransferase family 2 protein [Roseiflexaceae bacterium]
MGDDDAPCVVIATLNWNRPDDTLACLASAAAQDYPNIRLLVVDNASSDDSVAQIASAFPHATLVQNSHNAGFAGGCNLALRHALALGAEYVFLVNNDTFFAPDMLRQLVAHRSPEIGVLVPAIFRADAPEQAWSIGGMRHPLTLEKTGDIPAALGPALAAGYAEREYVVGCALLFSRIVLLAVGGFDERFFMYYEDMDLSLRVRAAGFRIMLVPQARMWHKVATSSGGSDSPNERYWMARSSVLFFRKHVRGPRWLVVVPFRAASALRTSLRLLRAGRTPALRAYWRGLRDGLGERPCT